MSFPRRVENLIADFRGLPRDYSTSLLKKELPIGKLLQSILKKYTTTADTQSNAEIFEYWPLIIGDRFAGITSPRRVTFDGTLIIRVQNSVVRQELFFQKNEIFERIQHFCPRNHIQKIVFSL